MHIDGIFHSGWLASKEQCVSDCERFTGSGHSPELSVGISPIVCCLSRIGADKEELYAYCNGDKATMAVRDSSAVF